VKLEQADVFNVAQKAQFRFDCFFGQGNGDWVSYVGDGVDDIDKLIEVINMGTQRDAKFLCDVGAQYNAMRPFDLEDLYRIRAQFIVFYGTVAKPNAYLGTPEVSYPLP